MSDAAEWWGLRPLLRVVGALGYTGFLQEGSCWMGKAWALMIAVLQLAVTGFVVVTYITYEFTSLEDKVMDVVLCAMCFAPSTCLIVTLLFRAEACASLRRQLRAADAVLTQLRMGTRAPYLRRRLRIVLQVPLVNFFVLWLIPSYILSWYINWYVIVAFITSKIYVFTEMLVYINIVLLLRDMFAETNHIVERELDSQNSARMLGLNDHKGSTSRKNIFADNEEHLQNLQAAHLYLSDACSSVNVVFGPCLLLTFALMWIMVVYVLYSLLVQKAVYAPHDVPSLGGLLYLCALNAASVAAVCICSAAAAAEARRTQLLLVRPLALPARVLTPALRLRLQLFLQQARVAPARFRCCNVIDVDLPFLTSFVATLLGYAVMLEQMSRSASSGSQPK